MERAHRQRTGLAPHGARRGERRSGQRAQVAGSPGSSEIHAASNACLLLASRSPVFSSSPTADLAVCARPPLTAFRAFLGQRRPPTRGRFPAQQSWSPAGRPAVPGVFYRVCPGAEPRG